MSNVFHDNCVVNWQPPDDDGGTEITGYIVEVNLDEDRDIIEKCRNLCYQTEVKLEASCCF